MKLTANEIETVINKTVLEIGKAKDDLDLMPPAAREFGDQLVDSDNMKAHVHAVTAMESMAKALGIPETTARTASFVSAAWIGYSLAKAEQAKEQVAELEHMNQ